MTDTMRAPTVRPSPRVRLGGGVLVALLLAACSAAPGASPAGSPTGTPSSPAPTASASPSAASAVPAALLTPIVADAATRGKVAPDAVSVVSAEAVTWTTGALGCPSPGVAYTQALVDGWHVVLTAGAARIDYRVTAPGRFKVCEGLGG
jgi:hypothetical protein